MAARGPCALAAAPDPRRSALESGGRGRADRDRAGDPPAGQRSRAGRRVGARYQLDWAVLAAIGSIESDHARSTAPGVHAGLNLVGCCAGPMQFDVTDAGGNTWAAFGVDGNGDRLKNVYDPADAVPAAARYLRAQGAPHDYPRAVFAYNHASWYVSDVLARAAAYRAAATTDTAIDGVDAATILANPRIQLTDTQRAGITSGAIDTRVLAILALAATQPTILVTALRSDHGYLTASGTVSNHAFGRAADIAAVDDQPCTGTQNDTCGRLASQLAQIVGVLHPTELIYCFDPDGPLRAYSGRRLRLVARQVMRPQARWSMAR